MRDVRRKALAAVRDGRVRESVPRGQGPAVLRKDRVAAFVTHIAGEGCTVGEQEAQLNIGAGAQAISTLDDLTIPGF